MAKVVTLSDYRKKETVTLLRELLVKASRGDIVGFAFNVQFKGGAQKAGTTGDPRGVSLEVPTKSNG